jgi:transcription antitermination factor NusG
MTQFWYAIRTKPGAEHPHRFYPGTNVEVALRNAGVEFYFPVEIRAKVHKKTGALLDKRWPLIPGYCFIPAKSDINWKALTKIDYVSCAVHCRGTPLPIRGSDIDRIKDVESAIRKQFFFDREVQRQRKEAADHKLTSREASRKFPKGSSIRIMDSHAMFGGKEARVLAATGRGTIKAMIDLLSGTITAEVLIGDLEEAA